MELPTFRWVNKPQGDLFSRHYYNEKNSVCKPPENEKCLTDREKGAIIIKCPLSAGAIPENCIDVSVAQLDRASAS